MVREVIVPSAREQHITVTATVAGAAVATLTDDDAELNAFVNQAVTSGSAAKPVDTPSSVRVHLESAGGTWLITSFEPV
jgi:Mce-associated membrane protein